VKGLDVMNTPSLHLKKSLILFVAMLCFCATAKAAKSTFNGTIRDSQGVGISDARVVLTLLTKKSYVREAYTNKEGIFSFKDLIPGNYDLRAEKIGFVRMLVKNLAINDSTLPYDMALRPQSPDRTFSDMTVGALLNIIEAIMAEHDYAVAKRNDSDGWLETGWKTSSYRRVILWTGYRRRMYEASVRSDNSPTAPKTLLNLNLRVQEHFPVADEFVDVDVDQETDDYFRQTREESLKILKQIVEKVVANGGKLS
jgi:hypothetical protein